MSTFSPSDAALEGFRLTREHPFAVLAWSGVYFLGILMIAAVMFVGLGPQFIAFLRTDSLQSGDPAAIEKFGQMLTQSWPAFIVALLIAVLILAILTGGMYRLVLRPQEKGFAHLRLGRDELRLAGAHLLLVCIGSATLIAAELSIGMTMKIFGPGLIPSLLSLAAVVLMAWVGVRLSLTTPLAFAERRISLRAAWIMTRGKFWRLFGMILLSILFYVMIWVLFFIISFVIVQLAGGQAAMMAPGNRSVGAIAALLGSLMIQLILPILQAVTVYAPFAVAYEQLKES